MSDWYILNYLGEPVRVDMLTGAAWLENYDHRKVALDTLPSGHVVSTVFLCLDHSHCGGRPVLFETLVFPPPGSDDDRIERDGQRYYTKAEAIAGHADMVKKWTP